MSASPELVRNRAGIAVDPDKMLRFMDAKIAATTNERHRRNLGSVREHMYREKLLDPEGVMATLSPKANYKLWVEGRDYGPKGFEGIRQWYVDTNIRRQRTFVIQYDLERVVVDDDVVVTEGQMSVVADAMYAAMNGLKFAPTDVLLSTFRQVVFWPVDENSKILGEDFYVVGQSNPDLWRKLEPHEIPEDWYTLQEVARNLR